MTNMSEGSLGYRDGSIAVLIVDDHPIVREGLRNAIDLELDLCTVAEASNGEEAIDRYRERRPDVVLMDLQMPVMDGLQAVSIICGEFPGARVIVLTTYPGDARVIRALSSGATSYLLKSAPRSEILAAIRAAAKGRGTLASEAARDLRAHAGEELLTPRELSVLKLVAYGKSNMEIANELHIAVDTVKARMKNILSKLAADDRAHAVTIAQKRGFLY